MSDNGEMQRAAAERFLPSGTRVLVVNIRPFQARLVVEQLRAWGAAGEAVSDLNQALMRLQDAAAIGKPFPLAIVDLPIGVFGAGEFGQIIAQSVGARQTRYVLSTTSDHAPTSDQLAGGVFCAAIVKPVTQAKLAEALAQALGSDARRLPRSRKSAADPDVLLPPIDVNGLMSRCQEGIDVLAAMIETFQTRAVAEADQVLQGLRRRDAVQVARSAHGLADAAASLAADGVRDAAVNIERFGNAADFDNAQCALQQLQSELERLKNFVRDQARSGKV